MIKSRFGVPSGAWLGGETEITYSDLKFAVNETQYGFLSLFISSLKTCMARPIPEGRPVPLNDAPVSTIPAKLNAPATAAIVEEYETSVKFVIQNWDFILQSDKKGARLHGSRFALQLDSARKVDATTKIPEYHTHFKIEAPDVQFTNLDGGREVQLISSSGESSDTARLLSVEFGWVTQPMGDDVYVTSQVDASVQLSGTQILLDSAAWDSSFSFLVDKAQSIDTGSQSDEAESENGEAPKEGSVDRMKRGWVN